MLFALGAASSAIDLLSSLIPSSSSPTSTGQTANVPANPFSVTTPTTTAASTTTGGSAAAGGLLSQSTLNTLISAQSETSSTPTSKSQALQDLFSQIDANGDGQITKQEFENALGAGGTNLQMADDVFNKMDSNGDGSISLNEMQQALQGQSSTDGASGYVHHHHHHGGGAGGAGGADSAGGANGAGGSAGSNDPLMQALQGATSTSTTNGDGSTTTTLTYADGTKITMTQPPAGSTTSSGNNASQSYNFTERMIERQAQLISANATQSLSMSV